MASQVLSGSNSVSYTNNTGQNVRIVINYMGGIANNPSSTTTGYGITLRWAGVSVSGQMLAIGRNLAFTISEPTNNVSSNNALGNPSRVPLGSAGTSIVADTNLGALPTELMLAPGQTFSATCGTYNIVVIPEAG